MFWDCSNYGQSSMCALWVAKDPLEILHHVDSCYSDQTVWMCRLISVLVGHICHFRFCYASVI